MKSFPLKVAVAFGLLWVCLTGSVHAQSADNDGCTDAILTGDYAFTISGQIVVPNGPVITSAPSVHASPSPSNL
jgi:hypothetical protein